MSEEVCQRVKEYLNLIGQRERLLRSLSETAERLRAGLTAIGGARGELRSGRSYADRRTERALAELDALEERVAAELEELLALTAQALERIDRVEEPLLRAILVGRYVNGARWDMLAEELHFSAAQTYRAHRRALVAFGEKNPEVAKDESI